MDNEQKALIMLAKGKSYLNISHRLGIPVSEIKKLEHGNEKEIERLKLVAQIDFLHESGQTNEALEICQRKEYSENSYVQLKRGYIFLDLNDFSRALEICNNPLFVQERSFIILKIKVFSKKAKLENNVQLKRTYLENALMLCSSEKYNNDSTINAQVMAILEMLGDLEEALKICENPVYENSRWIQMRRVSILLNLERFEEVTKLCDKYEHLETNYFPMSKITALVKLKRYAEALAVSDADNRINNSYFQSRKIAILIEIEEYDEAVALSYREDLKDDKAVQDLRNKAIQKKNGYNPKKKQNKKSSTSSNINISMIEKELLTKICDNECTLEDINTSGIDAWKVIVLTMAYYEKIKMNEKVVIRYLQGQIIAFGDNPDVLRILYKLKNRLMQKIKIFDKLFYEKLLSTKINEKELVPKRDKPKTSN